MMPCELVARLWVDIDGQRWDTLPGYFRADAVIAWPNTRERFTPADYTRANAEYPGNWAVRTLRVDAVDDQVISLVRISLRGGDASLHVVSYFTFDGGKIARLEEYFSEDGQPPAWRTVSP